MKKFICAVLLVAGILALASCSLFGENGKTTTDKAETTAETTGTETESDTVPVTVNDTETATDTESDTVTDLPTESETESDVITTDETTSEPIVTTDETTTEAPETELKVVVKDGEYEYYSDISKYLKYIDPEDNTDFLILVNKTHYLAEDYVPSDLCDTGSSYTNKYLQRYACNAYLALVKEMKAFGITSNTKCQSGYRSYNGQKSVYNKWIASEKRSNPKLSEDEIIAIVDTYSARPGTSEHQTGLALDFNPIKTSYEETDAFKFLCEYGWKFGFILRYGKDKTEITGYSYEPWHWRFVGRTAAEYIHEHDLTLEEYLEEIGKMPEPNVTEEESEAVTTAEETDAMETTAVTEGTATTDSTTEGPAETD